MKVWQRDLLNNITDAKGLYENGLIGQEQLGDFQKIIDKYPLSIPLYYSGLIKKNNETDPIYKMSICSIAETINAGGRFDTSGESENTVDEGIQHKYGNTVLLLSTNVCAMYCRHCFRKRLVGQSEDEVLSFADRAIRYIREHKEVDNVLITGGDAFMNSNKVIERYLSLLTEIPHLKFIRFGTRTPVVFPQRITSDDELVNLLKKYGEKKPLYVVTQFNHPNEITAQSKNALNMLRNSNVTILNQTVLLAGVNDNADTLANLFNQLVENGVTPYYLFQCRPVKGVKGYFAVPLTIAVDIVNDVRAQLSGVSKRFKFIMSHYLGKIEIVGKITHDKLLFKQHQSKFKENENKIYVVKLGDSDTWLEDDFIKQFDNTLIFG